MLQPLTSLPSGPLTATGFPRSFGRYTLLRELGSGGMAEVFLALQRSVAGFEKLVVIKRVLPNMNSNQAFIDMLLTEARIAATLTHPNIIQIYDVDFVDGAYYIAMEYVDGADLRSIVRQMVARGLTEFPFHHALHIVAGICAGLGHAHAKRGLDGKPLRIVHRDISPHNVLVTFEGGIKIVDFGIAKSGADSGDDTRMGKLKGKVSYMSPEQASGQNVDSRTDIFAAGIILFELTTGRRLFKGKGEADTLRLICNCDYPNPSDVCPGYPKRLEAIVMKALHKDRCKRYASAREMQADLEAYIRTEQVATSQLDVRHWIRELYSDRLETDRRTLLNLKVAADAMAPNSTGTWDSLAPTTSENLNAPMIPSIPPPPRAVGAKATTRLYALAAASMGLFALVGTGLGAFAITRMASQTPHATSVAHRTEQRRAEALATRTETMGSVQIESKPAGASIWLDGSLRAEKTPATIVGLPLGAPIIVKLTKDGFAPERREMTLTMSAPHQRAEFALKDGMVSLVVIPTVPNAKLYVDRQVQSTLHVTLEPYKRHTVIVTAPGYRPVTSIVREGPNVEKVLPVMLERK